MPAIDDPIAIRLIDAIDFDFLTDSWCYLLTEG
jgi:hypothetical protein